MDTFEPDQLKTVLGLTTSRVKDIAETLERNWTIQMVCAAVGIALVYDIADLPKIMCKYFGQESCTLRSAAPVFMVVVLYYFMKFGQLLTAFVEARQLHDDVLKTYLGKSSDLSTFKPILETTSFFEGYYSNSAFRSWAPLKVAYFLMCLIVLAVGQSAALFLLVRAYKLNAASLLVVGLAISALIILYIGFWQSKKHHLHTTKIVFTCLALVPACFTLFMATAANE
jgi:hypothetical protein